MAETYLERKARLAREGRRENDGYEVGSDPWQGLTNPDAFSAGVPNNWKDEQAYRTFGADYNYGLDGPMPSMTPGPYDLPMPTNNNNRSGGGGGGGGGYPAAWREEDRAWEIATREWERDQWEREGVWRGEDRADSAEERALQILWRGEDREEAARDRERQGVWREEDRAERAKDRERQGLWREEDREEAKRKRQERIASLNAYDEAMRGIYTPERVNAIYDPLVQNVNTNTGNNLARLGGITEAMTQRGTQARSAVSDVFAAGDQRLQAMRGEFGQQRRNTDASFGGVLSNMGVQGGVKPAGGYMDRLFANSRVGNTRAATIFDASAADRGALVGGLQGDVSSGMTARRDKLLSEIATDRAKAHQQSETALAGSLAQSGLARGQV